MSTEEKELRIQAYMHKISELAVEIHEIAEHFSSNKCIAMAKKIRQAAFDSGFIRTMEERKYAKVR